MEMKQPFKMEIADSSPPRHGSSTMSKEFSCLFFFFFFLTAVMNVHQNSCRFVVLVFFYLFI